METVTLKLPEKLLRDAARVAHVQDVTIGHLVRVLLAKEVARRLDPKTPIRADEGLLAALQALLARDLGEATGWDDLASRLSRHGYEFRPVGGGIVLYKSSCGTRVCCGSELGFAYHSLVRRFDQSMPGHPIGETSPGTTGYQPDCAMLGDRDKARLERMLGSVLTNAPDWEALIGGLARRNHSLRLSGTELGLYAEPQGRHMCNTTELGHSLADLVIRFAAPFPSDAQQPEKFEQDNETSEVIEPV